MSFKLTARQTEALRVIGSDALHVLLEGGSRSGKTFVAVRAVIMRALAAPRSRHAIVRFRFNHVKASVGLDTMPKVLELCFPEISVKLDKTDWIFRFPNGSEIWLAGLDDKERTEKILGLEFATIYLNEASQIPYASCGMALTRLAQKIDAKLPSGEVRPLRLKLIIDCNPPSTAHWTYKLFHLGVDPDTGSAIDRSQYACLKMNPTDNEENLAPGYLNTLRNMASRLRRRFFDGEYANATANALWSTELLDRWRTGNGIELPDMQRIVVAIDPSGADEDNATEHDAVGIIVAGLGVDGNGYVLEDLTVHGGPGTWGKVATTAYDRHRADKIIGEGNYGGAMVKFVVQAAKPGVPFKMVNASRGKVVRAEPISVLMEEGKIRLAGVFNDLEEELCSFTTTGYVGPKSPNRADAMVWAFTELFPAMTRPEKKPRHYVPAPIRLGGSGHSWMGA